MMSGEVSTVKDKIGDATIRRDMDEILIAGVIVVGAGVWTLGALSALSRGSMQQFSWFIAAAVISLGILVAGWYFERTASAVLALGAVIVAVLGIIAGWEAGIWLLMGALLIAPMLLVAGMLLFAEHEEKVIERAEHARPIRTVHA